MEMRGAASDRLPDLQLPRPRTTGGMPVMDAIKERRSTRTFTGAELALQELADLLWAGFGFSREFAGKGIHTPGSHTAPGAHNWQEIDIFVALESGVYLYHPAKNVLSGVLSEDVRRFTAHPTQPFVLDAPVILIYVANLERMDDASDWDKSVFPWADTAVIAENIYLACASLGVSTVLRALFDRPALTEALQLKPDQMVTFSQCLGFRA